MSLYAIGTDIGGTNIKLVLIDELGKIHLEEIYPTPQGMDPEEVTTGIISAVNQFKEQVSKVKLEVEGIGFTVPHFFEGVNWTQRQANNMTALENFDLRPRLVTEFGESIALINDLSAAAIAEHMYGKGRGFDRLLLIALGTGVSTAFINEHGLVDYNFGSSGDTGQIIVDPNGVEECTCGGHGCLEAMVSAKAIRKRALSEARSGKKTLLAEILQHKGDITARDVSEAAHSGDDIAQDILHQVGHFLGVGLVSLMHIFRPSLIVVGGGVSQAGDLILESTRVTMNRLASPWYLERLKGIEITALGNNGGAIGCASLILYPGMYIRS